ncbi:hypothetical protein C7999DRAFT_41334 [Corynascus novoguineensis]|uniref:N-acetyltransferase domain-containing protein n=1 Tax=Corynascus novoguineensis TaxID=1126955 RepID=A0AAN7CSW2_9PEZI|nr:hypothetical protein C7999DRAFT_41334 [Corynascus novoguineensis]
MAKSSHAANNAVIAEPLAQQHSDNVQVIVKLRSTSKAALNCPISSDDWEKSLLSIFSDSPDTDDRRSTPSEDAHSCGPDLSQYRVHSDDIEDFNDGFDDMDDDKQDFGESSHSSERSSLDEFAEWKWLEQIDGIASVDHNQVADCDAKLIRRWRIRNYYDHEIRKGSGAWGRELNRGDILLFESLNIEPRWQHQGVGAKVVNAILEKVRSMSAGFFAFAQPGYLTGDLNYDCEDGEEDSMTAEKQLAASEHFWRSLGFRRDWDEPERSKEKEPIREPLQTVLNSLSDSSALDGECVRQLQETFPSEANAPSPMYVDENLRNAEGHTPLEALQSSLEENRTRRRFIMATTVISDDFEGFSSSEIACLAALTGTEILDIAELSNQDISAISSATDDMVSRFPKINTIRHTLRLQYGCTCGECLGGFLSPKMRFALLCQAQYRHDTLNEALHASGSEWVAMNAPELVYLATPVRQNMNTNKSMRQGFTNMCKHIARCLEKKRVPNEETVLHLYRSETSEWPPVTAHYLQRGGTVAAVVMMLFNHAMHGDEWAGDGTHLDSHEDEIKKLPVCRNDHEFGISMVQYVDLFGREIGAC